MFYKGVGYVIVNLHLGVGQLISFVPKGGGEPYVFYLPHFQMFRPNPPPPYFLTSPWKQLKNIPNFSLCS